MSSYLIKLIRDADKRAVDYPDNAPFHVVDIYGEGFTTPHSPRVCSNNELNSIKASNVAFVTIEYST